MVTKEEKVVLKAISQIAVEHKFFTELRDYIEKLKATLIVAGRNARSENHAIQYNIQKLFRNQNYIGIAQQRFSKYEYHVEDILNSITEGTLPVGEQLPDSLRRRLHLEASNLLNDSSRYEGRIYRLLVKIKNCAKDSEYAVIWGLIDELRKVVDDAEKWIVALSADLSAAKRLVVKYEDPLLVDFTNRHTLAAIMEMMRRHDLRNIRIQLSTGWVVIHSEFGPGGGMFDVSQDINSRPMNNSITIGFSRVYKTPYTLFDKESYTYGYDPATAKRPFKKVLGGILKIVQDTVRSGKTPQVPVSKQIEEVF